MYLLYNLEVAFIKIEIVNKETINVLGKLWF